jgi:riboflavin kinase/FMN adenylyltransferase
MKTFLSSKSALDFCKKGSSITIGNFDGVHLGHQKLIEIAKKKSHQNNIPSLVYTFNPHPVVFLSPKNAPLHINTLKQKTRLLKNQKVDGVIFEEFNETFAHQSPQNFFETVLVKNLNAKAITVGYDFTFGSKRSGTTQTLKDLCKEYQIDFTVVPSFMKGEILASSSIIRKFLLDGDIKAANNILSRPYFIEGKVIHGEKRGGKIGFKTANLKSENELIPDHGVYQTACLVGKKIYPSVTNIGFNPTFDHQELSIETHLLDFEKNIYGKKMVVFFLKKLRNEKKFDSVEDLIKQINQDIVKAKNAFTKIKIDSLYEIYS